MAAITVSKKEVGQMHDRVQSLQKRIGKFKDKAEETMEKFVRTLEVGSAALGVGVLQGRGGVEVMGVPLELGAALGLNMLGYFGAAGKHSGHLNNLGDGALAGYLAQVGRGIGVAWKNKQLHGGTTTTKGDRLTPQEVREIVAEAAR